MILYIVTHSTISNYTKHQDLLEQVANDECKVLHCTEVSLASLTVLRPWAICHSGGTFLGALLVEGYRACITDYDVAQIGFCAGHQLCARLFGSRMGLMRPLRSNEVDPFPDRLPGHFKEYGWGEVEVIRQDPLFVGMSETITVWQDHAYHITQLSSSLLPLARSTECPVQAWVHRNKPFYGVQFHPETSFDTAEYPDGLRLLTNFFALARAYEESLSCSFKEDCFHE